MPQIIWLYAALQHCKTKQIAKMIMHDSIKNDVRKMKVSAIELISNITKYHIVVFTKPGNDVKLSDKNIHY